MVTFRSNNNNNRRPPFRSNNNNNRRPPFRSNNEGSKFSNNDNFKRSIPGRNNHNASKLIEKYNDLAREALASEDKILSENYFQHADHFTRIQNEQESIRMARINSSPAIQTEKSINNQDENSIKNQTESAREAVKPVKADELKPAMLVKKAIKTSEKKTADKKLATS
jgi:hypothetical protein